MAGFLARRTSMVALALVFAASARVASAQELEPRAYSASPLGTNFFAAAVGYMDGEVLFDPTVPITDAHASIDMLTLGYGRTFGLGGKLGLVTIAVPGAVVHAEGLVGENAKSVRRRGFADLRVKASLNLLGAPAVTPEEFAKTPHNKTILGVSLTVQAPNGQYDPTLLVNLGTNRWAFKPEIGVSVPVKRWSFDVYAGAWFFTTNDAFYPGTSTKHQDPLTSLQAHVSYTFKNRAWLAFDATWYGGGETTIDSNPPSKPYSNTRVGGTFSLPVAARQSIKFAASRGASARTGSNFDSYVVGWQLVWFDRPGKKG